MSEPFPDTNFWCKCNSPGETLDDIQVEAFAVVREAARRTLGMRHFDVQVRPALVPDFSLDNPLLSASHFFASLLAWESVASSFVHHGLLP